MSKVANETVDRYRQILARDPKSKVFAALAEAYREMGQTQEAEEIARKGTKAHPDYASGFVALGRTLIDQRRFAEALPALQRAVELAHDNLLGYQLLGQVHLELKQPKEALRAHKLALFLNPLSQRSRQAVEKLESLTADEYEDDLFTMKNLSAPTKKNQSLSPPDLERSLSLIDALIVRNDLTQASELLKQLQVNYPKSEAVKKRWKLISDEDSPEEQATLIKPMASREFRINQSKQKKLQSILAALQAR